MRNSTAALFLLLGFGAHAQEIREQFRIEVETKITTSARAHSRPVTTKSDATTAASSSIGDEQFQCGREERRSAASASGALTAETLATESTLRVNATAAANGGHEVQCLGPIIVGSQDTEAAARVFGHATMRFVFAPNTRPTRYRLKFENLVKQRGAKLELTILDSAKERPLYSGGPPAAPIDLVSSPGQVVTIDVTLEAVAQDRGGCCNQEQAADGPLRIRMTRAPILAENLAAETSIDSSGKQRRIIGGEDTSDFPEVGALLYEDELNCTATVIAPQTAITAAHCVYARDVTGLSMAFGPSVYKPERVVRVTGVALPDEEGFRYDDLTLADDIALLYLDEKQTEFLALYVDRPSLDAWRDDQRPVDYIGYGYTRAGRHKTSPGIKRRVAIPISELRPRSLLYKSTTKHTCSGDSGGPGFVIDGNDLFLLGITSSGDGRCEEYGESSRLDAFKAWLTGKVR